MRYSAALLPTHPDKLTYWYSVLLPGREFHSYGSPEESEQSVENEFASMILSRYDPAYASRMWGIAADNRQDIWKRYYAVSKLRPIDPSNKKWAELASDIIAHHDFAKDPFLSPSRVVQFRGGIHPQMKEHFKKAFLKKIDQCSESGCCKRSGRSLLGPGRDQWFWDQGPRFR